jgi:ABC-2 type transport system ATP-binding protein
MNEPAVSVSELRQTYPGGIEAVRNISFDVRGGDIFGMLGPNGAGRITTIGALATTVRPSVGRHPSLAMMWLATRNTQHGISSHS